MARNEDSAAAVFREIREQGPINRSEIARRTELSPSAVSMAVKRLLDVGIVAEVGDAEAPPSDGRGERLGRPPILLRMRPSFAAIAGAKLDRGELNAVLTDLKGHVLARRSRRLDTAEPQRVVAALRTLVGTLARTARVEPDRVAGLGLGISGLVDSGAGVCLRSVVLDWTDVPIGPMLRQATSLPVAVENDANTLAIAERMYGAAHDVEDFAVVSLGTGIGAGMFLGGELYRGRYGAAGEIGHCSVRSGGPRCACGKRGCLEAVAGVRATLARAADAGLQIDRPADLGRLATAGDEAASRLLADIGDAIGLALSHLVNLFDPELLILTGSGAAIGGPLKGAIEASLAHHVFPTLPRLPELIVKREQRDMWARGAASLAAHAFFEEGRWEALTDRSPDAFAR